MISQGFYSINVSGRMNYTMCSIFPCCATVVTVQVQIIFVTTKRNPIIVNLVLWVFSWQDPESSVRWAGKRADFREQSP